MSAHKATPEQWADAGAFASDTRACLLELRARVEALEANAANDSDHIGEANKMVTGSLVKRVAVALNELGGGSWDNQARAAIREVAAWFGDKATPGTPQWIAAAELAEEIE